MAETQGTQANIRLYFNHGREDFGGEVILGVGGPWGSGIMEIPRDDNGSEEAIKKGSIYAPDMC